MQIGYARVSGQSQHEDLQIDSLNAAGCEKIFTDKISGSVSDRPGLAKAKELLRKGDTLVVWRLDRLARSLHDLIAWMKYFETESIALRSLTENIDTTTPTGRFTYHIFSCLCEFERSLIIERTRAGLDAARARGRKGGRPKALDKDKKKLAIDLYNKKELTIDRICNVVGVSKPTLYKYIKESHTSKDHLHIGTSKPG